MDAVSEAQELFQPCNSFPEGPLTLEQLQSQAEIVTERAPDRSEGGSSHAEYSLYCICLPSRRVQDLKAGESQRGGCKFNIQWRRKGVFDPEHATVRSFSDVVVYHCNRGPADRSCDEPELIDPAQRPKQGPGSRRSKVANNESIKVGCQFHFSVRQPVLAPDVVIVK